MSEKRIGILFFALFFIGRSLAQSPEDICKAKLDSFFVTYQVDGYKPSAPMRMVDCKIAKGPMTDTLNIYVNDAFASQPLTPFIVQKIYQSVYTQLPIPFRRNILAIYGRGLRIESLIPESFMAFPDNSRLASFAWNPELAWVRDAICPFYLKKGLQGTHLGIWASHGYYYDEDEKCWQWQRPSLFCTREDLYTQGLVNKYLLTMLESAGAICFTPRERDRQRHEVIVDNDDALSDYKESDSKHWNETLFPGFARKKRFYTDYDNPFFDGTARQTDSQITATDSCRWIPMIPESGNYAIYVSYQSFPTSISDAHYTIVHGNIRTTKLVNQRMGGGTWVYLGTFHFDKGHSEKNQVVLTNKSGEKGIVTADAVRFGGGMGNMFRASSLDEIDPEDSCSGMPRYLEGARYSMAWAGMPWNIYRTKEGADDYKEDINTRPLSINYLSGGSILNPDTTGLGVPLNMALAVHTDAGQEKDRTSFIGTLGICTTVGNEDRSNLKDNMSRWTSYDFANILVEQVTRDLRTIEKDWPRREIYDRNYSETRNPEVPSAILETLSHQNYADMRLGLDPNVQFLIARAIYKAILKYTAFIYQRDYVVQPLPVRDFQAKASTDGHGNALAILSWSPSIDTTELAAGPSGYMVYTAREREDYDNGKYVDTPEYKFSLSRNVLYRFKVLAVNEGGESFPSEELVARVGSDTTSILIVNGYNRLSGPRPVNTLDSLGFDLKSDMGVSYMYNDIYSGYQVGYNNSDKGSLGQSDETLCGRVFDGNTFNYPFVHASAMNGYTGSISSCNVSAVETGQIALHRYDAVDMIFGLQKDDEANLFPFKTFSPELKRQVSDYMKKGGGILFSGAYVGRDMSRTDPDKAFAKETLGYGFASSISVDSAVSVMNEYKRSVFPLKEQDESIMRQVDAFLPSAEARPILWYSNGNIAGYFCERGISRIVGIGFPLEKIPREKLRNEVFSGIMRRLLKQ